MYNLLSNAIKFTPDGGLVSVTAAIENAASLDLTPTVASLRIAVADTGIGIKVDDQERIFKKFEQVDSSYGRQQRGTGLGLALTQNLVEMHGGRLWVESQGVEGKGSVFTFLIPLLKLEVEATPLPGQRNISNGTLRPLLEEASGVEVNK
jgi:two-component system, NarL family, sensor histidine kinase BarA